MNGRVFYNEIDPFAAAWLRELIADGLLPAGEVDERDIRDIYPGDLDGCVSCHFFAGIGGWALALRLADWDHARPVWTGSCPCQPFSAAGRRGGIADERHLWPHWHHLIRECRPATVFGEQVEAAVRLGWLDLVRADLEGEDYAFGAAVLGAHSVGAPHIRQRLWWCAVANAEHAGPRELGRLAEAQGDRIREVSRQGARLDAARCGGSDGVVGNAVRDGLEGSQPAWQASGGRRPSDPGSSPWDNLEWLPCRDGKARPAQLGLQPLAHGISNRVGTLRGAGNAIVPQVAAEFVRACA